MYRLWLPFTFWRMRVLAVQKWSKEMRRLLHSVLRDFHVRTFWYESHLVAGKGQHLLLETTRERFGPTTYTNAHGLYILVLTTDTYGRPLYRGLLGLTSDYVKAFLQTMWADIRAGRFANLFRKASSKQYPITINREAIQQVCFQTELLDWGGQVYGLTLQIKLASTRE